MPPFRVVLADQQKLFLQSIKKNIDEIPDLEVVGEFNNDPKLLEFLAKSPIDLIIMDVVNLQEIETAKQIKMSYPEVKILFLTMEKSKGFLLQAILARVDGYMLKENTYSDLVTAIDKIRQGGKYFCNIISGKMAEIIYEEFSNNIGPSKQLSAKEIKVLVLRCQSKSCRDIGKLLSLSHKTIANHIFNIRKKLNLKTQSDLIKYAIKQGYLP